MTEKESAYKYLSFICEIFAKVVQRELHVAQWLIDWSRLQMVEIDEIGQS